MRLPCNLVRIANIIPLTICQDVKVEREELASHFKNGFRRGLLVMDNYNNENSKLDQHISNIIFTALTKKFPVILYKWRNQDISTSKNPLELQQTEVKPEKKEFKFFYTILRVDLINTENQLFWNKKAKQLVEAVEMP